MTQPKLATLLHNCRIVVVVAQPGLSRHVMMSSGQGLLRQDVCLARSHLHHHDRRATFNAEGDIKCRGLPRVAMQLSLFDAVDPPDLMGLVDVGLR